MNLDEIVNQLPLDQLASQLGVEPEQARQAVNAVLPALVGGMQANAQDEAGASSLANALSQHDNGLADSVLDGSASLDEVNTTDGSNIVGHVFGQNTDQVVNQLAGVSGTNSALISKLLPLLAPLVMSYIAKRLSAGSTGAGTDGGLGGLGDMLNNALGGGAAGGSGGLADILGQVLGSTTGGSSNTSNTAGANSVIDILGGLFGGGRR